MKATADELVDRLDGWEGKIQALTATVDFEPTAGSVYSGVIKEYHDVKGFILLKRPEFIRVIGQAPVVRTTIFDMVSDGKTFSLNIPPKNKFVTGPNALTRPAKNALENMRPQHFSEALLVPPVEPSRDRYSFEEAEEANHKYYVLAEFEVGKTQPMIPARKIWFDRSDLQVARLQEFDETGAMTEDVHYSAYQDFQGIPYPSQVQISRPVDDYAVTVTIQKATFNEELSADKFELTKPPTAELVDLGKSEAGHGE